MECMADVKQLMIDAKILKVLAVTHPELVEEAKSNVLPLMNDLMMIRELFEHVSVSRSPENNYLDKLLFIAVILRLFNPDALILDCKLNNGLRRSLAECLGDTGQNASYYIGQARAYMKIKSFSQNVANVIDGYLTQNHVS
jgi:hypothetical protein